jgi:hypothetical protein
VNAAGEVDVDIDSMTPRPSSEFPPAGVTLAEAA